MLNALTKGIAKKLDAFGGSQEEKTEKEDELLRSLVDPLEDQIKALKEKLRATDEQLQKCRECGHSADVSFHTYQFEKSKSMIGCRSVET